MIVWLPALVLAPFATLALIGWLRERAFWRRMVILAFSREPIANLSPPTITDLRTPVWMEDADGAE